MQLKNIGLKNKGLKTYDLRRLHPNMRTLQSLSAYFTDFITHNSLLKYGHDYQTYYVCVKQLLD